MAIEAAAPLAAPWNSPQDNPTRNSGSVARTASSIPPGESGCAANSSTALVAAAAPTGSHPEFIGHDRSSGLGAGRLTSLQDVGQQGQKTRTLDRTRHLALLLGGHGGDPARRSEERRVGKEGGSKCISG